MTAPTEEEQLQFIEMARQQGLLESQEEAEEEGQQVSRMRSLINAPIKGLIGGIRDFGRTLGPLQPETAQEQEQMEAFPQQLEEFLPTQEEGIPESILQKAGKIFPWLATGGAGAGGSVLRSLLAAGSSEAVKQTGGGEFAQTLAEFPALISPNIFSKRLMPGSEDQKRIVELGQKIGMTPQEITPLIQEKGRFTDVLARFSPKRGRTQRALEQSKEAAGNVYNALRNRPESATPLSAIEGDLMVNELSSKLRDMPSKIRNKITEDFFDLSQSEKTGNDIINFFQDVNANLGSGAKQLSTLKNTLMKSLDTLSPELARDFDTANKMYGNFANISGKLKPTLVQDILTAARGAGLMGAVFFGNYPIMAELLTAEGAKRLAREMLINPRFQNLGRKFVDAIKKGSVALASSAKKELVKLVDKTNPEASDEIEDVDIEEFIEKFGQ